MSKQTTYKDAGVDIEKAESSLRSLKAKITATHTPQVLSGIGLFGGFYDLSELQMKAPVLVSSTDGVGTKLRVAMMAGVHDTVGQDLVNHCINDIAVCGARPLFFLDYFAAGKLQPQVYEAVISGLALGCQNAGIPLIGGETAEMPDFYRDGDYDMCGTIVGAVDKGDIIDGSAIAAGDVLIGVSGNGLHTNGFTLARHVLFAHHDIDEHIPELGSTIAQELLRIHPNYYALISRAGERVALKGAAHITGGGLEKNTRRLLRKGLNLEIDWQAWEVPAIFSLIEMLGNVPLADLRQTFNMGIGLVLVVAADEADRLLEMSAEISYTLHVIGRIV